MNCFWRHQWNKWETYVATMYIYSLKTECDVPRQKRTCSVCGLEQRRDLE